MIAPREAQHTIAARLNHPSRSRYARALFGAFCVCAALIAALNDAHAGSDGFAVASQIQIASEAAPRLVSEIQLKPAGSPNAIAWSPDGKLFAAADSLDTHITVWSTSTWTIVSSTHKTYIGPIGALAFTGDSRYVITAAANAKDFHNTTCFSLIEASTGKVTLDVAGPVKNPAHIAANLAHMLALSPAVHRVVAITSTDPYHYYLNIFDSRQWSLLKSIALERPADAISMNPVNGDVAILRGDGFVQIYSPDGARLNAFKAQVNFGASIAFSPDGKRLATSASGNYVTTVGPDPFPIHVWDAATWTMAARLHYSTSEPSLQAWSFSFSPDDRYLASLNLDGKARLWDARSLSLLQTIDDHAKGGAMVSFSPDGKRLAIERDHSISIMRFE